MSGERLPGLQLAVKLLAQIGDDDSDRAIVAVHDLAEERTNTAAHVASIARQLGDEALQVDDIAVRVLGLAAEADKAERSLIRLEEERDTLRAKYGELLVALHGIGAALGIPEGDRSPYSITCGVLERVNRLAEIEAQEPVALVKDADEYGPILDWTTHWVELIGAKLYAAPAPAVPEGWKLVEVERDELRARLAEVEAQAAEIERLRESLERILSAIPPQQGGGGFIVEHYSLDGDYAGYSSVDPFGVVYDLAAIAHEALGGGNG